MTPEEAFRLFGIGPESDQSDITKAYYELSRQYHPDTAKGDSEKQAQLNAAREIASAYIADRKALVPIQVQQSLQEFDRQLAAERAGRQAGEVVRSAVRHRTRPLRYAKYVAFAAGAMAATFGWFGENLLPQALEFLTGKEESLKIFQGEFKVAAIVLAAIGGLFHFIAQAQTFAIEAFKERLDDIENCAAELSRVLDYQDRDQIPQRDIIYSENALSQSPLKRLLGLDLAERRRLLILKSVEHGLLENIGPKNVIPSGNRTFKLTFAPSQFAPEPRTPSPPPKPMELGEALAVTGIFMVMAGILDALTVYLYPSFWAWLPGVFGGFLSLGFCGFFLSELAPALWRRRRSS